MTETQFLITNEFRAGCYLARLSLAECLQAFIDNLSFEWVLNPSDNKCVKKAVALFRVLQQANHKENEPVKDGKKYKTESEVITLNHTPAFIELCSLCKENPTEILQRFIYRTSAEFNTKISMTPFFHYACLFIIDVQLAKDEQSPQKRKRRRNKFADTD